MNASIATNESYRKTQIDTASPENLILMLYDGALRFITQADEAFEAKNNECINNMLLKTQAIFTELLVCLDKNRGGEIAVNLERLYIFFLEKLAQANVQKNPLPMREIKPLIEDLRNTWAEVIKSKVRNAPPPVRSKLNVAV